jgi:cystathionine beta-synthase
MEIYDSLLELIGETPMYRFRAITRGIACDVVAKLEMLNPGGSVKDRIGIRMIQAAEREGLLQPGGTIVEPTSGNTGVGIAMAAAAKGYKCIFTMPDKMSQEKISLLRAYGAEVVIAPTAVPPDHPDSYYRVADRLAAEIPGAFQPNQYFNQANPITHYETTGPEVWTQTDGRITHFVAGVGTGGTISGTGRYLKEQNPDIQVIGADPDGSVYSTKEARPYLVEGVGEDFWPETFDPEVVDRYVTVTDKESFLAARMVTREEGLLLGGSGGLAVHAALQIAVELPAEALLVVLLPDSGRGYLSKLYNDSWMLEHGFLDRPGTAARIGEIVAAKRRAEPDMPDLVAVSGDEKVGRAIDLLQSYGISQIPVADSDKPESVTDIIGSVHERGLLDLVFRDRDAVNRTVAQIMDSPLPTVELARVIDDVVADLAQGAEAVVVVDGDKPVGVLSRADLLEFLAHQGA